MNGAIVRYDAMCRAIADAYAVDEVKDIRDQAIALEIYARQAHNVDRPADSTVFLSRCAPQESVVGRVSCGSCHRAKAAAFD